MSKVILDTNAIIGMLNSNDKEIRILKKGLEAVSGNKTDNKDYIISDNINRITVLEEGQEQLKNAIDEIFVQISNLKEEITSILL